MSNFIYANPQHFHFRTTISLQISISKLLEPKKICLKNIWRKNIDRLREEWSLKFQPYNECVEYIYHINNYRLKYILVLLHE